MVDDVIAVTKCGNKVVTTNTSINTFIKLKKLKFSDKKCARIHVGKKKKCDECAQISVNEKPINESHK